MKKLLGLVAAAGFMLSAGTASATPITFNVQAGSSLNVGISVTLLNISGNQNFAVSGSVVADVNPDTGASTPITLDPQSGGLTLADNLLVVGTCPVCLNVNVQGVGAVINSGPIASTGSLPTVTLNLGSAGGILSLNSGQFVISGLVSSTVDLATTPFDLTITDPTNTSFNVSGTTATWTIPIAINTNVIVGGIPLGISVNGTSTLVGTLVPEPGTALLLVGGLAGLVAMGRRKA